MSIFGFGRKKRKDKYEQAIRAMKSGDWDTALTSFRACLPSLINMDRGQQGNCIMALAILDGAAGNKHSALHSVTTAQGMCPEGSPNARILAGLKGHIENPPESFVAAPVSINGKAVDLFYYTVAQIHINVMETGTIGSDDLADQITKRIASDLLRKKL